MLNEYLNKAKAKIVEYSTLLFAAGAGATATLILGPVVGLPLAILGLVAVVLRRFS